MASFTHVSSSVELHSLCLCGVLMHSLLVEARGQPGGLGSLSTEGARAGAWSIRRGDEGLYLQGHLQQPILNTLKVLK